ncbi:MAG: hypothetical protein ABSG65_23360 [Bryobacteraceae bacterium]|jgi:hypothetical protein
MAISCRFGLDDDQPRATEPERTGASALMMQVAFAAQFVASLAGGASIAKFGYSAMLACAGGLAAVAAVAFRMLPAGRHGGSGRSAASVGASAGDR